MDDIFDEEFGEEVVAETEPQLPPEPVVEPEEEVIDIDDSTASGRLSNLGKKWIQTRMVN